MCYDAYADLVKARDVDIIYVATPHSHHFQHVMLCLEAGKAVLCEKPMTVNAKQARVLYDKAKEKKLFLMEAVWTRFFPVSVFLYFDSASQCAVLTSQTDCSPSSYIGQQDWRNPACQCRSISRVTRRAVGHQ